MSKGRFITPLKVEHLDTKSKFRYKLDAELIYTRSVKGEFFSYTVPKGFISDLTSSPRIFWSIIPPSGTYNKASLLHDYVYSTKLLPRDQADKLFLEATTSLNVNVFIRKSMYYALRLFGWKAYNKVVFMKPSTWFKKLD